MSNKNNFKSSSFFGARLTAIISSSLVLFLVGILVMMSLVTNHLSSYVKENIGLSVVLTDKASDKDLHLLAKNLEAEPFVKSSEMYTKQRALKELADELGENPKKFLGSIPLMASIDVKLKSEYANNDSINKIEKQLRSNKLIREVLYRKDLIQMVNDNMNHISFVLLIITILMMLISFVVLNNTIRLHIYSKRFILQTMKLVGATHGFIRRPFIVSNIYNGILAAFIAIGLISGLLYYLVNQIEDLTPLINVQSLLITFGSIFVLGIILSVACTFFSLNRYLRMKNDSLYSA